MPHLPRLTPQPTAPHSTLRQFTGGVLCVQKTSFLHASCFTVLLVSSGFLYACVLKKIESGRCRAVNLGPRQGENPSQWYSSAGQPSVSAGRDLSLMALRSRQQAEAVVLVTRPVCPRTAFICLRLQRAIFGWSEQIAACSHFPTSNAP